LLSQIQEVIVTAINPSIRCESVRRISGLLATLLLGIGTTSFSQSIDTKVKVGNIYFFGILDANKSAAAAALTFHTGDETTLGVFAKELSDSKEAVLKATGKAPTDIANVCCNETGGWDIYVGLGGATTTTAKYRKAPIGYERMPAEVTKLVRDIGNALFHAISSGKAQEDRSHGYALSSDEVLRALQLRLHSYAAVHRAEIISVLKHSSSAEDRASAAMTLGYSDRSKGQLDALASASQDPDAEVRNNATRALLVIADVDKAAANHIPMRPFEDMVCSGTWTDRNKGAGLLMALTKNRNIEARRIVVLALEEIADWDRSHAVPARIVLGRLAGIKDTELFALATGPNWRTIEKGLSSLMFKDYPPDH